MGSAVCRGLSCKLIVSGCSQLESVLCPWVCGIWHPRLSGQHTPLLRSRCDSAGSSPEVLLMLLNGAVSHSRPSNSSQPVASRPCGLGSGHRGFRSPLLSPFVSLGPQLYVRLRGASRREVPGLWPLPAPVGGGERCPNLYPRGRCQGPQLLPRQECRPSPHLNQ